MYDELIKRLRVFCEGCKLWDGCKCCLKGECSQQKSLQAADAIEELQKDLEQGQDYYEFWKHKAEQGLKMLQVAISNMPCWIPVTERLPDGDTDVLVTDGNALAVGYYRPDANAWDSCEFGWIENRPDPFPSGLGTVTHWMPLPQPPKDSE